MIIVVIIKNIISLHLYLYVSLGQIKINIIQRNILHKLYYILYIYITLRSGYIFKYRFSTLNKYIFQKTKNLTLLSLVISTYSITNSNTYYSRSKLSISPRNTYLHISKTKSLLWHQRILWFSVYLEKFLSFLIH